MWVLYVMIRVKLRTYVHSVKLRPTDEQIYPRISEKCTPIVNTATLFLNSFDFKKSQWESSLGRRSSNIRIREKSKVVLQIRRILHHADKQEGRKMELAVRLKVFQRFQRI